MLEPKLASNSNAYWIVHILLFLTDNCHVVSVAAVPSLLTAPHRAFTAMPRHGLGIASSHLFCMSFCVLS